MSLQLPKVFWRAIGQVILHLGPDELIGIELGGVGREPVRVTRGFGSRTPYVRTLVNHPAVPEQLDRSAEMAQEVAQEHDDLRPGDVVGMECMYSPSGSRRGTPTGRKSPTVCRAVAVAHRGVHPIGAQVLRTLGINRKPLSSRNTRWAPRRAAFFYSGHVCVFQCSMAASSRWRARRSGFCQLQSRPCRNSFHTPTGL